MVFRGPVAAPHFERRCLLNAGEPRETLENSGPILTFPRARGKGLYSSMCIPSGKGGRMSGSERDPVFIPDAAGEKRGLFLDRLPT